MKNLRITVNGVSYDVQVEELSAGAAPAATPAPAVVPAAAPKAAPKATGATKVTSPMPGTIISVNVQVGQQVSEGQAVVILEAMKMENEIPAPTSGTVASIEVEKGATVETGAVLITLN